MTCCIIRAIVFIRAKVIYWPVECPAKGNYDDSRKSFIYVLIRLLTQLLFVTQTMCKLAARGATWCIAVRAEADKNLHVSAARLSHQVQRHTAQLQHCTLTVHHWPVHGILLLLLRCCYSSFFPTAMWFINIALLILKLSVSAEGFSTCQSYDLEDHKSKRIEAVRGQILSKLRIRSPPDPAATAAPQPNSVPFEVMLLYNSTKDLLKERARHAESACERESSEEDYYAKEVQRVDMLPQRADSSEYCLNCLTH